MSLVDPTLEPAERMTVALFAEFVAKGMLGDDAHVARMYEQWRDEDGGVKADFVTLSRQILRVAAVDPGLLRWCDWPDCLVSYAAHPGPTERGWMRHPYALLCPTHAPLGHGPTVRWDGDVLTAHCSCSASAVVSPTNGQAVKAWWRTHVAEVTA
ncbi:hypothetical protein [Micromonospora chalcea]|uniref:hypothetical protein n=1 Tax=Micromonospora chalcea TaxID=1874 RepID=UPI003D71317A